MVYKPLPGTRVIGLGHRARQGKDSAADAMLAFAPRDVRKFSFADDLRAVCRVVHGMTTKDAPLLQRIGVQERERDPDVWIRSVYYKIHEVLPAVAVITDVRFPNEADFVKQLGGTLIRIDRYDKLGGSYTAKDRDPYHISETALADYVWDETIINITGRPDILEADACTILTKVRYS